MDRTLDDLVRVRSRQPKASTPQDPLALSLDDLIAARRKAQPKKQPKKRSNRPVKAVTPPARKVSKKPKKQVTPNKVILGGPVRYLSSSSTKSPKRPSRTPALIVHKRNLTIDKRASSTPNRRQVVRGSSVRGPIISEKDRALLSKIKVMAQLNRAPLVPTTPAHKQVRVRSQSSRRLTDRFAS